MAIQQAVPGLIVTLPEDLAQPLAAIFVAPGEKQHLYTVFGEAYRMYQTRVGRLIDPP